MDEKYGTDANNLKFSDFDVPAEDNPTLLLTNTNKLLSAVGLSTKKISSIDELSRVSSSLFVAIFESLFHMRIDGIIRNPQSTEHYERNAQRMIDSLSKQIQVNLKHITGKSIVSGDMRVLSNLVHILIRIVSLTSQESLTSYESIGYGETGGAGIYRGPPFKQSHPSSDSISTHESAFADGDGFLDVGNPRLGVSAGAAVLSGSPGPVKPLSGRNSQDLDALIKDSISRAEQHVLYEQRLEAARWRREQGMYLRGARCRADNMRRAEASREALQRRWTGEAQRRQQAECVRASSQEHVLLRKVYKGLLKRVLKWRIEEEKEEKEKRLQLRNQTKSQIESLQALFEERLRLLLSKKGSETGAAMQEDTRPPVSNGGTCGSGPSTQLMKEEIIIADELIRSICYKEDTLLKKEQNNIRQKRQQELLRKSEAHRDLLVLLSTEDWQDMLRTGSLSPPRLSSATTRRVAGRGDTNTGKKRTPTRSTNAGVRMGGVRKRLTG